MIFRYIESNFLKFWIFGKIIGLIYFLICFWGHNSQINYHIPNNVFNLLENWKIVYILLIVSMSLYFMYHFFLVTKCENQIIHSRNSFSIFICITSFGLLNRIKAIDFCYVFSHHKLKINAKKLEVPFSELLFSYKEVYKYVSIFISSWEYSFNNINIHPIIIHQ